MAPKKKKQIPSPEVPAPSKHTPQEIPGLDPEEPVLPAEPDIIPEDDPFTTPPYEIPPPGEAP
jgi:hypothetical protein